MAGSIGSEICKQLIEHKPKKIVVIDSCEENLYLLDQKLNNFDLSNIQIFLVLENICNEKKITKIVEKENIDIIFHAAAYKHVPLVELNPLSGLLNNILSTHVICKTAAKTNVKQVLLISSDKAVRPSNIMGASKRISELIIQAFADKETNNLISKIFSMVRFGNVLGSSGSVIPLFQKQIAEGGPITITHKDVIRYFMTIPEASALVLQSAALSKGGEVFLLDMGKPVKIIDLAKKLIKLSGFEEKVSAEDDGIEIVKIGLRPGEKLYEELLIDGKSEKTIHPLIYKSQEKFIPLLELSEKLDKIYKFIENDDFKNTFKVVEELVPDWKGKY